jgi:hypothetical protein
MVDPSGRAEMYTDLARDNLGLVFVVALEFASMVAMALVGMVQ